MFNEKTTMEELMANETYWNNIPEEFIKDQEEPILTFNTVKYLNSHTNKYLKKYTNSIKYKIKDKKKLFYRGLPNKRPDYYRGNEKDIEKAKIVSIENLSETVKVLESKQVWVIPEEITGIRIKRGFVNKEETFNDLGIAYNRYGEPYFRSLINMDPYYPLMPLEFEILDIIERKEVPNEAFEVTVGQDKVIKSLIDFENAKIHFYNKKVYNQEFCCNIFLGTKYRRGNREILDKMNDIIIKEELNSFYDLDKNYANWEYEDGILAPWEKYIE